MASYLMTWVTASVSFDREQVNPKLFPGWYIYRLRWSIFGKRGSIYIELH